MKGRKPVYLYKRINGVEEVQIDWTHEGEKEKDPAATDSGWNKVTAES